jgi:hypothetical protein
MISSAYQPLSAKVATQPSGLIPNQTCHHIKAHRTEIPFNVSKEALFIIDKKQLCSPVA